MAAVDVLPLIQAKAHLNQESDAHNVELTRFIEAAVPIVERHLDEVLDQRPVTERRLVDRGRIRLNYLPVASLTSVTQTNGGAAYPLDTLAVDAASGVVTAKSGVLWGEVDVVYLAGYAPAAVPPHYKLGVAMVVGEMWQQTQRAKAGGRRYGAGSGPDGDMALQANYFLTPSVLQLLGHRTRTMA